MGLSGCSDIDFSDVSIGGMDEETVKEEATSPSWEQLYRNNDEWEGEPVQYSNVGISDINDNNGEYGILIPHPDRDLLGDELLYCWWDGNPFREGDTVTIWGVVTGLYTYMSLTGERTVPEIDLVDIELTA